MDLEIRKKDGNVYKMSDFGIVYDFVVESISMSETKTAIEGASGTVDYGATYSSRNISVPMKIKTESKSRIAALRDKLYSIVTDTESFYIRELRRTKPMQYDFHDFGQGKKFDANKDNEYVGGKQYLVRMISTVVPEQIHGGAELTLEFQTTEMPFAESLGRSKDLEGGGFNSEPSLWSAGMNLSNDPEELKFKHTVQDGDTERFHIYNPSDITVNMFEHDFSMTITGVIGSGTGGFGFQITNSTNGTRSRVLPYVSSTDKIVYDRADVRKNDLAYLRETRRDFVELSPGWNEFGIYYCQKATIEFDFKFYYK